jgi:beta-barrel assembly-enhancing protease
MMAYAPLITAMKKYLILPILFISALALAQPAAPVRVGPLQPAGKLPASFTTPSHLIAQQEAERRKAAGDPMDEGEMEFTTEVNYYSQQRLTSGLILYNDPMSNYITDVARLLLKDDTALFNKLRFYVYKTPEPNAFTSATGVIMITVGMLAQVDNEAQLAYILSHEIMHYKQKHMLKGFRKREKLEEQTGNAPSYMWSRSYFQFTREHELEADAMGFDLFSKSNYRAHEALRMFDVLEYSDLPFDDMTFDTLWFNRGDMKIPGGYFRKEVDPIYSDDNYEDRNSTHPNVRKRRMALISSVDSVSEEGRQLYLVSKEKFIQFRERSRYEVCRLHMLVRDYPEAIYCAYMLLQKHPDDIYLEKMIGYALFNLTSYSQTKSQGNMFFDPSQMFMNYRGGRYSRLSTGGYYRLPNWEKMTGQQQQLFHLFYKLEPDELTALTLTYNWDLYRADTTDRFQAQICDSLFSMLVFKQNLPRSYFSTISAEAARQKLREDSIQRAKDVGETGDSKYSRLDKFKLNSDKERFVKFAFVDLLKDSLFLERFNYYTSQRTSFVDPDETPEWLLRRGMSKKEKEEWEKYREESGYEIDKLLVICPEYETYQQKKRKERELNQDYAASELGQVSLCGVIRREASAEGVQTIVLSPFEMDSLDTDSFAAMATLNEWFFERLRHGNNRYTMTLNNKRETDSIAALYNVRYIMFTAVESATRKRIQRPVLYTVTCVIFPPALYKLFIPQVRYQFESAVLDLKTGEVVYYDYETKRKGKEKEQTNKYYNKLFKKLKAKKLPKPQPPKEEVKPEEFHKQ